MLRSRGFVRLACAELGVTCSGHGELEDSSFERAVCGCAHHGHSPRSATTAWAMISTSVHLRLPVFWWRLRDEHGASRVHGQVASLSRRGSHARCGCGRRRPTEHSEPQPRMTPEGITAWASRACELGAIGVCSHVRLSAARRRPWHSRCFRSCWRQAAPPLPTGSRTFARLSRTRSPPTPPTSKPTVTCFRAPGWWMGIPTSIFNAT